MVLGKEEVKIHKCEYHFLVITIFHNGPNIIQLPDRGQCLVGSLTGAVASQKVTEAFTKVG